MSYINQRVIAVLMSTSLDNKQTMIANLLALSWVLFWKYSFRYSPLNYAKHWFSVIWVAFITCHWHIACAWATRLCRGPLIWTAQSSNQVSEVFCALSMIWSASKCYINWTLGRYVLRHRTSCTVQHLSSDWTHLFLGGGSFLNVGIPSLTPKSYLFPCLCLSMAQKSCNMTSGGFHVNLPSLSYLTLSGNQHWVTVVKLITWYTKLSQFAS